VEEELLRHEQFRFASAEIDCRPPSKLARRIELSEISSGSLKPLVDGLAAL